MEQHIPGSIFLLIRFCPISFRVKSLPSLRFPHFITAAQTPFSAAVRNTSFTSLRPHELHFLCKSQNAHCQHPFSSDTHNGKSRPRAPFSTRREAVRISFSLKASSSITGQAFPRVKPVPLLPLFSPSLPPLPFFTSSSPLTPPSILYVNLDSCSSEADKGEEESERRKRWRREEVEQR